MAVIAYNDQLRSLLANVECVLALDTAADFLGLTNGAYRDVAQIFVSRKQNIEGTEQILVPSLEKLECEEWNGLVHCIIDFQHICHLYYEVAYEIIG